MRVVIISLHLAPAALLGMILLVTCTLAAAAAATAECNRIIIIILVSAPQPLHLTPTCTLLIIIPVHMDGTTGCDLHASEPSEGTPPHKFALLTVSDCQCMDGPSSCWMEELT